MFVGSQSDGFDCPPSTSPSDSPTSASPSTRPSDSPSSSPSNSPSDGPTSDENDFEFIRVGVGLQLPRRRKKSATDKVEPIGENKCEEKFSIETSDSCQYVLFCKHLLNKCRLAPRRLHAGSSASPTSVSPLTSPSDSPTSTSPSASPDCL